ncbi:raffinose/stachyose/melibiose transport system permease protein [Clostridium acidisoli DSM 12555]|jgi:raffinose/stachyose/melibiose transport system permease protein|uniref:Raffinose/stachyose/melibiose transport system permease protein n=1 Tax=Clostridium acidisoli DSM 12555 TaxID=1121291 RepID=A0A1W1XDR4_9CLOT|nr:sugar ABC transporter permease [Clostridium acidisoli]SMC22033.1 raffinose/stachyose/melibiose transport system permease protein [Clostridium acidisoli DSM 12555]
MENMLRNKKAIFLFVFPAFLIFFVIVLLPIFFSFQYSLLKWDGISKGVYIGLQNYKDLFVNNSDGFLKSVENSVLLAVLSVCIQLPISLFFALVLARGIRGEKFFRTVYFIPVILATVIVGQLWMKIYNPDYGLLNFVLSKMGLKFLENQWLASTHTVLGAVFIPILWQYIGYHMLLMYASAKSISPDIYEAARIDGASESTIAFKITIPLIKPILKVCVVFAVIGSFKSFDLIYVLTNGGPMHASEVPTTLMYTDIFSKYQYGYGSAMAIFIVVECFICTILINRLFGKENN